MYSIRPFDIANAELLCAYACKGMGFDRLCGEDMGIVYASVIAYNHIVAATEGYACYDGDNQIGFLLYRESGKKPIYAEPEMLQREKHYRDRLVSSASDYVLKTGAKIDEFILSYWNEDCKDDGELLFLASDIDHKPRGIGRALLEELARRHKGETIALLSDSNCTLAFYEGMGFACIERKAFPNPHLPDYTCYIFKKTL